MTKIRVEIDGCWVEGRAAVADGTMWVHLAGETFTVSVGGAGASRRRGGGAGKGKTGEVVAPMPGKIVKVFANPGDAVAEGDVLLVMEAMKMEYTLKAPAAGTVRSIRAAAGDQVALAQTLIELEPEKGALEK